MGLVDEGQVEQLLGRDVDAGDPERPDVLLYQLADDREQAVRPSVRGQDQLVPALVFQNLLRLSQSEIFPNSSTDARKQWCRPRRRQVNYQ
ncbi:hypothetical protein [Parafrankia sp. FMc2]|uniref:hypothetical protein n=1 Tax=Parafrankia sp. FMc2 TaxID=3233196 RepID=UPI0034D48FD7